MNLSIVIKIENKGRQHRGLERKLKASDSKVYAHVPKEKHQKLEPNNISNFMVEYPRVDIGYKNPIKAKVVFSKRKNSRRIKEYGSQCFKNK